MKMDNEKDIVFSKTLQMGMINEGSENNGAMSPAAKALKRGFDILCSALGLVVTSPLFLVICWLIRREDGGPAIFRQERIGYGGRPFMLTSSAQ